MSTDQRARELAEQLCEKWFEKGMRASWRTEMVDDFATALADERRRVWEEAYEYVKQHHFNVVTSKHATKTCVVLEAYFRAKAHAGQEGRWI